MNAESKNKRSLVAKMKIIIMVMIENIQSSHLMVEKRIEMRQGLKVKMEMVMVPMVVRVELEVFRSKPQRERRTRRRINDDWTIYVNYLYKY